MARSVVGCRALGVPPGTLRAGSRRGAIRLPPKLKEDDHLERFSYIVPTTGRTDLFFSTPTPRGCTRFRRGKKDRATRAPVCSGAECSDSKTRTTDAGNESEKQFIF